MRLAPLFLAAFVVACDVPRERAEKRPDGPGAAVTRSASDSAAAGGSDSTRSLPGGPASPGGAGDGLAELARMAAARQAVLIGGEGGEEVPAGEFVPDAASDPAEYAGDYHFGDSEWESNLTLTVQGNTVTGTLEYGGWDNDERWVREEVRLEGRIVGARLIAPGWSGVFVRYQDRPGLVMLRAPTEQLAVEFGNKL